MKVRWRNWRGAVIGAAFLLCQVGADSPALGAATFGDGHWIGMNPGFPGADAFVYATALDSSGRLYIGGDFAVAGGVIANRIAKWNGSAWEPLGLGLNGTVRALAVSGDDFYAGGTFTTATNSDGTPVAVSRIAKWDGNSWSAIGSGVDGSVRALAIAGNHVFAGGDFLFAGDNLVNRIARWDGSNWSALGSGMNGTVRALAVSDGIVYAGGGFMTAGGSPAYFVAQWNGSGWSALGSGLSLDGVNALAVLAGEVCAANGGNLKKWNGSSWIQLRYVNGGWYGLAVSAGNLYAAGNQGSGFIARWNGAAWSDVGSVMNNLVFALAVSGSTVYAGGDFTAAGGNPAYRVAQWDGNSWSALGSGRTAQVQALAVSGNDLYAGGAGGSATNRAARWNGSGWTALGLGVDGGVFEFAVAGNNVFAGGQFTTATNSGGLPVAASRIARWNGASWSGLGSGMNDTVWALAVSGNDVYAGGVFTTAGGSGANYIAKWNGSSWSTLGLGMDYVVSTLVMSGDDLFAGGGFTTATNTGGVAVRAYSIAKWNGSSWSALGSDLNAGGWVHALAVSGVDLYAGGGFTRATNNGVTVAVNHIARWNGNSWSALGMGLNGYVYSLAVSGSDLYAAGDFTTAMNSGGDVISANRIAKWDGSNWSALGSGMNYTIDTLAVAGGNLYAGGSFTTVGGKVSPYVARALIGAVLYPGRFGSPIHSTSDGFSSTFFDAVVGERYRIQASPSLASGSWNEITNFVYTAPTLVSEKPAGSTTRMFLRAVTP